MSEEISTLEENVIIDSIAHNDKYHLTAYKGEEVLAEVSHPANLYGILLQTLWRVYLENGQQKPKLLGHVLSDDGLVTETLHYIAPNNFYAFDCGPLDNARESFIYWLKSQSDYVGIRIGDLKSDFLNTNLDNILARHLERKKVKVK